ncbi:M3 family oligoendopeptidase [Candidatus Liberibacter asiaticus]|uniref:Oligoendopeptidase F n=3 Tax=Liberibacter asiaticus TaxID=34021 RepID=C6XG85_LIBAP|nr:M3 family oligoendopeptidase [Candidatus Liberibacter asiaticus]ACT57388.1 oligoendopeptidase F [Candidatus Liberibacter asiaticus str. psy62]AGH17151.1 oligoendopeptidase F [Candidatus Liberibacter asiaticus str. gxpsy]ALK07457.1 oligoendopeptidase F [Candidatus Liberibacter asiaticus]ASK52948.1 oligoendopeptidase F [Candidatus Liberibacter asiaticus]AWL14272.1 oligoendopeptidase F [Candidatus Liberibacter asiaticus]
MTKYPDYEFFSNAFFRKALRSSDMTTMDSQENLGNLPRWNLEDLYPSHDSQEISNDMECIEHESLAFKTRWEGNLAHATNQKNCHSLGAAIAEYERICELIGRIASYAMLSYNCNLSSPTIRKFYTDINAKLADFEKVLIFFALEINTLDEALLEQSYAQDPLTLKYSAWIKNIRKIKKHLLSNDMECLLSDTSQVGREALKRFFCENIESLRFKINDQKIPLTKAYKSFFDSDREVRKSAAKALSHTFNKSSHIFSFITNTLAKDEEIQDRWRKYEKIADSRHLSNNVEPYVIEALMQSVKNYYPKTSHRYYELKKKWLKLDTMYFWDRLAPLPGTSQDIIPFEVARDLVLQSYAKFSPQMSIIAEKFFTHNWIDAPQYDGKGSGAFAHGTIPSVHPYILLNYLGKPQDVMTLAHELGHGIHFVLSSETQGILTNNSSLTLAETASIFGETLTFDSLLQAASSKEERKILLANKIEDMLNSIVRQISFYDFELKLHTERRSTGDIPTHRINEIWLETQKESLGPAFDLSDLEYGSFWMMVPHFIESSFYVYAYAFGNCLVNSLYDIYKSNTVDCFKEKYLNILRAGNSKHYSELLLPLNINLSDPNFWERGLQTVEKMIDDVEKM